MLTQFSSPKARLGLDQFDTTDDLLLQKGGHRTLVSRSSSFSATFLAIVPCQSGILSRSVCGVFSRLQDFGPLARLGSMEYAVAVVMSLTIEISSELEPILKAEAGKAGLDPTAYTHQLLRASLPTEKQRAPSISTEETRLLNEINQGLSAEELDRYRELIRKRQEETINQEAFGQLDAMTRRLEGLQVRRLESLAKLASLRKLPLAEVMARLEIPPADVL